MSNRVQPSGLDRYPAIRTSDLDEARLAVVRTFGDVSVDLLDDPCRFMWRANVVDLGPVAMVPSACQGELVLRGTVSGYVLQVLSGGQLRTVTREGSSEITGGRSAALFSPDGPVEWRNGGESASTLLRIDPGFLAAQLEALTGVAARRPVAFAARVPTDGGAGGSVERLCRFLLEEIERGSDALTHPMVATCLSEALVRALLLGQPHDHTHLLDRPAPPPGPSVVRLVEEYLEAHAAEPIRVAALAALTGVGVRAIEAAFRAHRGSTPAVFLRKRRLELARARLLAPEPGATVESVAHACGFLALGPFEAAYAARFGERPVETHWRALLAATAARPAAARLGLLSPREREVCEHAARGMINKQIAAAPGISERTVKAHRAKAMEKLGAESAAALGSLLRPAG
jgi:DNA-binding CsgD family transcriptional regulator